MEYTDALRIISDKKSLGIKPGLERIKALLEVMDNPQDKIRIIHVAGTNGKGTVASIISNSLQMSGCRVGLFTSPYVVDYCEQIQVNCVPISHELFSYYVEKYSSYDVTEFELLTAIMYKYFYDSRVDFAVVECGMGGLDDATNVEKKNISVITSVSLDHTDFLGSTVEEIAQQKAGIIKENSTCVLYPNEDVTYIFEAECRKKNSKLIYVDEYNDFKTNNVKTALAAISLLKCEFAREYPELPARQERINGVLLDGGHNVAAAQALEPLLNDEVALIAMLNDKDADGYLSLVAPRCKSIICTSVDNPRSMRASDLAELAKKYCNDVTATENPHNALSFAKQNGLSLACGSFYLAQEIRKDLL